MHSLKDVSCTLISMQFLKVSLVGIVCYCIQVRSIEKGFNDYSGLKVFGIYVHGEQLSHFHFTSLFNGSQLLRKKNCSHKS